MQQLTSMAEANRYLTRFYVSSRDGYNLDTIKQLMDYLGNPQEKFKTIHVAGTSGKTSTSYYMSALLTAAGKKTGLTVSPHIDGLNERVQINGQPVPEGEFCERLTEFLGLVEKSSITPSRFEVMVGFAYWCFEKAGVEYAVVEVGLGGLKDGTNVIERPDKIGVITDIGLDHVDMLGRNLSEIARQKIGIVHPGNAAFTYEQPYEVMEVFNEWCRNHQAELNVVGSQDVEGILPEYQKRNWHLAHEVYKYLSQRDSLPQLSDNQLQATQLINIPGRMDVRKVQGKQVIMDGAHNLQKMTAFIDSFKKLYPDAKPAVLISLKEGKEYKELVPLLASLASRVIVTNFEVTQDIPVHSMDPEELAAAFKKAGKPAEVIHDQAEAVKKLLGGPEEICLITGSFYLISQIRNNNLV